ncbi:MAG: AAA family ATPase [Bernardetiaceae bacterium]|nr:AAA family ATPase [Bernardetiaceae bacterium]
MISVKNNFARVPKILQSEKVRLQQQEFLALGSYIESPFVEASVLMHEEVKQALLEVYNHKCAYCECEVGTSDSPLVVAHYRPPSHYYWLCFEWTNLLLLCESCALYRDRSFPIEDEQHRIINAPNDEKDWKIDAPIMLAEHPLLLHPQLDVPERFFAFDKNANIYALHKNLRAETTIELYHLNRGNAALERKERLASAKLEFVKRIDRFLDTNPKAMDNRPLIEEAFQDLIEDLKCSGHQQQPYSLLGRHLCSNFNYFFTDNAPNESHKTLLKSLYDIFFARSLHYRTQDYQIKGNLEDAQNFNLQRIEIKNIRCFDSIEVYFPHNQSGSNVSILSGTNGSGKSTILQLIAAGLSGLHRPLISTNWSKLLRDEQKKGEFFIDLESGKDKFTFHLEVDRHDSLYQRSHQYQYNLLHEHFLVLGYSDLILRSRVRKHQNKQFEPIASLFGDGSYLKTLDEPQTYKIISENFEEIQTLINRFIDAPELQPYTRLKQYQGHIFYFETHTGLVPLSGMSEGFRQVFSLIFDMIIRIIIHDNNHINKPEEVYGIILLDEIDQHLSISWQQHLVHAFETIFPNMQFIISTQSPFTIQSLSQNNILFFSEEEEHIKVEKLLSEGLPWGWTISEISTRLVGKVTEISPALDKKILELHLAVRNKEIERAEVIRQEVLSAIPSYSASKSYIENLLP